MIFGQPQMKKHEVIIDITNNFLALQPGHYINVGVSSAIILCQPTLSIKTVAIRIENYIIFQKIVKTGLTEDITDSLQVLNKLSNKKKGQINKSKQKASIREIHSKNAIINSLNNSSKEQLSSSISTTKKSSPTKT